MWDHGSKLRLMLGNSPRGGIVVTRRLDSMRTPLMQSVLDRCYCIFSWVSVCRMVNEESRNLTISPVIDGDWYFDKHILLSYFYGSHHRWTLTDKVSISTQQSWIKELYEMQHGTDDVAPSFRNSKLLSTPGHCLGFYIPNKFLFLHKHDSDDDSRFAEIRDKVSNSIPIKSWQRTVAVVGKS